MVGETVRAKLTNLFDNGGAAVKENHENYQHTYKYQFQRFASGGTSLDTNFERFLRGEDRTRSPSLDLYTDEDVMRKALGTSTVDRDTKYSSLAMSSIALRRSRTSSSSYPPEDSKLGASPSREFSSSPPIRDSLDLASLSRFNRGTHRLTDLRSPSSSSSSGLPSYRNSSLQSSHEDPTEIIEPGAGHDRQLDFIPHVEVPFATLQSGFSSYRTCNEEKPPPRVSLAQVFAHLSEVTTASDTASIKPIRSRHPTDTNPLSDSSDSLQHYSVDPSTSVHLQPTRCADGTAETKEDKHVAKKGRLLGRSSKLRPKPTVYFKRARKAIHIRRVRLTQWLAHRFGQADEERGRTTSRQKRQPRIPPRCSSVGVGHRRTTYRRKDAPLFRARSMFALGSIPNPSDSTMSQLDDDDFSTRGPRSVRSSWGKDYRKLSMHSLNKKLSRLSFNSSRNWRRTGTVRKGEKGAMEEEEEEDDQLQV